MSGTIRAPADGPVLQFGEFRLDRSGGGLTRAGIELPLRGKSLALLHHLVENAGRLVTRDELLRAVWPEQCVSPGVVRISVREVRAALGDDRLAPRFIETVGRRGYRFAAAHGAAPLARAEFVGRDAELTRLHARLEAAIGGRRQIVFVSGAPGIGKTALIEHFASAVRRAGVARVGRGTCVDLHDAPEPYLPVFEMLDHLCREHAGVAAILDRWAPSWLAQMPGVATGKAAAAQRRRMPTPTRQRMLREFADAMDMLAQQAPLVLVFEDLHWSDASTLDLLTALAARTIPACLLVIATYRPVEAVLRGGALRRTVRALIARNRAGEESLELLTPRDVDSYLRRLLAGAPLDAQLAGAMHAKTEGNPLFLVAIVEHLLDRGVLAVADGHWRLGDGHESLPPSLRELVAREVSALPAERQHILAAASAVGIAFDTISVAAATGLAQPAVEACCAGLAEYHEIIGTSGMTSWPNGALGGAYHFLHAVYRDTIYDSLPPMDRVRLHRAIGVSLEAGWAQSPAMPAAVLALHFEQGADWPRAVQHHLGAAEAAKARLADPEVMAHAEAVQRLLAHLPASPGRDETEMNSALDLGAALLAVRGYGVPETTRLFTRALDLAIALEQPLVEMVARGGLYTAEVMGGDQRHALSLAADLLAMAERFPLPFFVMIGHTAVGASHYNLGNLREARAHLARARAAWEPDFPRLQLDQKVLFLGLGALVLQHLGEDADAAAWLAALIEYQAHLEDPLNVTQACDLIAGFRNWAGQRADGGRWAARALDLAIEHGFPAAEALAKIQKGYACGDLTLQRDGFAALQAIGYRVDMPVHRLQMAETLLAAGDWEEARGEIEQAFAAVEATGEARHLAEAHRLRAACLRAAGESAAAAAELKAALAVARRQHAVQFERRALVDRKRGGGGTRKEGAPRKRREGRTAGSAG